MTTAVEARIPADGTAAAPSRARRGSPRRRLFAKYAFALVGLVSLVLVVNGLLNVWFSYDEARDAAIRLQREKADAAAQRIEDYIAEIEKQIGWTTATQWASSPIEQRRFDFGRLQRQVPAITELIQLDSQGHEQLEVSRLKMDVQSSGADYSADPRFTKALAKKVWFGPVYFRKESEPYMTMAVAQSGRNAGVTVAEVNLKLIWDVITAIKIGKTGYAYVVDGDGRLIAHPDISRVLRNTDLSGLTQVAAARGAPGTVEPAAIVRNLDGHRVLSASAAIPKLGWLVFVEQPLSEALAPLYTSVLNTGLLLMLGLAVAILAGLLLARRMTGPIRALDAGAARIGAGALDHRITVHTGDELEELAERFNTMAADLQSSYADLEKKVEDRTAELKEALDQQTATAEVLGVINSSPGDLAPVFDAMLEKATQLCEAAFGILWICEDGKFHAAALHGAPEAYAQIARIPVEPRENNPLGRMLRGERLIVSVDVSDEEPYRMGDPMRRALVDLAGARSVIQVALVKDDDLLGSLTVYRQEVRPFADKQITLLQNFAAQAVIAIENARLITETREALEQQTATAEVLGVINSSPGDLAPVFGVMLEQAMGLCEAQLGLLLEYADGCFRAARLHGAPPAYVDFMTHEPIRPGPRTGLATMVRERKVVHIADLADEAAYHERDPLRVASVELAGMRTFLAVPLIKDVALTGAFVIYRQEVRPFSEKQIALLQNFAAQAVIAMENARLITETREALEQQTATAEVLGVINSSPGDLAPVFDAILDRAMSLCEAAFGGLFVLEGQQARAVETRGISARLNDFVRGGFTVNTGRLVRGEPFQHVADLTRSRMAASPEVAAAVEFGARTMLNVALRKDDTLLGFFSIFRQEVRPFSDKQVALLENFAAQAVIAMENARLITETREALEQQTATAEVLQVINSSPGDLAPVFDAMLEKATRLCNAAFGILQTYDGDSFHAVALHNVPSAFAEFAREPARPVPGGTWERMLAGEPLFHEADLADSDLYRSGSSPVRCAFVDLGGARTSLRLALRKDATLLGMFNIYRQEVRPFSEKEIALLQNFAAQAVIAMENARLITETREALEQQTATAEVLGVINSSPGNLTPVFEAVLEKALTLCEAAFGVMRTYDGEGFQPVAARGLPPRYADYLAKTSDQPGLESPSQRVIHGEDLVHVADVMQEERYRSGHPYTRALVDLGGARTVIVVALRKDRALLGTITIYRQEPRPVSDKQIALLQNFAAQAVIAIENARLITETREALEQQTATAEVLGVINSSPGDLTPVFDAMLEKAMHLCEAAFGVLRTYDGERLNAVAMRGVPDAYTDFARETLLPSPETGLGRILHGESLVHIADIRDDEVYRSGDRLRVATVELGGARTLLVVPLRKEGVLLGVFTIYRQEVRPFSEKQIALLQNFAAQAVIAMENARLITETREALEQQTATAEVLGVINSSPGDLRPVFDSMLEKGVRLSEAAFGILCTFDGECFRTAAMHGVPTPYVEHLSREPFTFAPGSGPANILAGQRFATVADLATDPLTLSGDPTRRALVELGGARTGLAVPLRRDAMLLGIFLVFRPEVRPFTEKQIALLENFAAQAVIAMENARLITELRQRTHDLQESLEYQTATSDVLKVISRSTFDLQPVLDTVLATAARLCSADIAGLARRDGEVYRVAASYALPPDYDDFVRSQPFLPGRGTVTGRTALEGRVVHIADIAADPDYAMPESTSVGGIRTALGVPLLREREPIGVIWLARQRIEPFSERQIELVSTFADQSVIAMENARLLGDLQGRTRDLQESLEYQTATSDVLKVISQSGAELEPVLDMLVETAARICEADKSMIYRLNDGLYRMAASFGFDPEYKAFITRNPIVPTRGTLTGRTVLEQRPVYIEDAATDPEYTWTESQQRGNLRTLLGVPLFRNDTVAGVIALGRSRVAPFTEKQIALVTTFADQAVIAIENARLFNELRERTTELGRSVEELKMLSEVGQAVSSTLDLRSVLSTILTSSLGLTWANAGAIFRYSRAERAFHLVEAVGWDEALTRSVRDLSLAETETAMGEAVTRRLPIQLADTARRASNPLRDLTLAAGFRSALIVPLVGAERILGAILLMRHEAGEFPPETVRLMQTLASQSVLALQNARLFREIADKSEQLALASQHKSQFLANMSHELRTPLNAILGYAELLVDGIYGVLPDRPRGVLERIQNNGRHLLALINDVLDLAKIEAGQLTLTLEDYALAEVVRSVVTATEPLATAKGLKFTAAVQDGMPIGHGDARRVSQVLLNLVGNAIKFTEEGEVEIRAAAANGQFVLSVHDTGPGIADADQERIFGEFQQIDNTNTRNKGGTGLGLAISKRMVEIQGGTISVESVLGQGSTFRVVLPVHVDEMMEAAE